jgi:hypothetical protein
MTVETAAFIDQLNIHGAPMKLKEMQIIRSVLKARIGGSWFIYLPRAHSMKMSIFRKTRWAKTKDPEAEFVKRMSIAPALYTNLESRVGGEKAFKVMEEILLSIGCHEQWEHLRSMDGSSRSGMARLMAFNELMDQKGTPRFNSRVYIKQDENICHFKITRCIFHDFFLQVGTPELTKIFCEVDRQFFPQAFIEFEFHRNGSWENTIAYGKDHCEFVFERRAVSVGSSN